MPLVKLCKWNLSKRCTEFGTKFLCPALGLPFHFLARHLTFWHAFWYTLACPCRRSPRLRHGIRKPRPSSVELSTDLKDVSEGEDVFYTYRASVSSSKDSEGDSSLHQLVSVPTNTMCFSIFPLGLHICLAPVDLAGRFYARAIAFHQSCISSQMLLVDFAQQGNGDSLACVSYKAATAFTISHFAPWKSKALKNTSLVYLSARKHLPLICFK